MKTVIFGGTFNPFHSGHLNLMENVISEVKPDRFIVMPAHVPPHKQEDELMSDADRLEMCKLAVRDYPGVEVSDYEISAGGKSYTVKTLEYFHRLRPHDELYFAMGSDMFITFLDWYRADRIIELAAIICGFRDNKDLAAAERVKAELKARGGRCIFIHHEPYVCSSTDIREKIESKEPIDSFVPAAVAEYIEKRGLYRDRFKNS